MLEVELTGQRGRKVSTATESDQVTEKATKPSPPAQFQKLVAARSICPVAQRSRHIVSPRDGSLRRVARRVCVDRQRAGGGCGQSGEEAAQRDQLLPRVARVRRPARLARRHALLHRTGTQRSADPPSVCSYSTVALVPPMSTMYVWRGIT